MFSEIIKSLFITSLTASVLTGIITLAKPVTRKLFGYAWHYYIWIAVLIVSLLPVRISLPQNEAIPVVIGQEAQMQVAPQNEALEIKDADTSEIIAAAPRRGRISLINSVWLRQTLRGSVKTYLGPLWLAGAMALLLTYLTGYFLLLRKIRKTSQETACPELRQYTSRKGRYNKDRG